MHIAHRDASLTLAPRRSLLTPHRCTAGSNFIINLFLAVLFDSFTNQNQALQSGANQKAASAPEAAPGATWSCLERVGNTVVYVLIALNTVAMCANYAGDSPEYREKLASANVFFVGAFSIEMVLKFLFLGCSYFGSYWNRFDFVVTWCSILDLLLDYYGHDTDFLRALRVARVLRLLRLNRKTERFEKTVLFVYQYVLNLSAILVLIMGVPALRCLELSLNPSGS